MPARSAKPWFHKKSGYWCTSKQDRRIYLDRDYRVAAAKLRQLRASDLRVEHGGNAWLDAPFAVFADEFMEDVKAQRAEATRHNSLEALLLVAKAKAFRHGTRVLGLG